MSNDPKDAVVDWSKVLTAPVEPVNTSSDTTSMMTMLTEGANLIGCEISSLNNKSTALIGHENFSKDSDN